MACSSFPLLTNPQGVASLWTPPHGAPPEGFLGKRFGFEGFYQKIMDFGELRSCHIFYYFLKGKQNKK